MKGVRRCWDSGEEEGVFFREEKKGGKNDGRVFQDMGSWCEDDLCFTYILIVGMSVRCQ